MRTLKTKIFFISLSLLVCLGVIFGIYSVITTIVYQKLRLETIRRTIKYEAARANNLVTLIERSVLQLSTSGHLFYYSQSIEIGEMSALEMLKSFPAATGGGFWFEPYSYNPAIFRMGIHAFYDKETGQVRLDEIQDDYDYHNLSWYREIIEKVQKEYQVVWVQPYIDDTTFMIVTTAGAGIYNEKKELLGISIIDWELDEVVKELATIKPTENSIVMMYDPNHDFIVAHTYHREIPEILPADKIKTRIPGTIESASKTWKEEYDVGIQLVMMNDTEHLALSRVMNNEWQLIVYAPLDEIFLDTAQRNLLFTAAFVLCSIFILWSAYQILSKIVYKPIKKLTTTVEQISLGHLDIKTEVNSKDEIGMLALAFNKMTQDLKNSIEAYKKEHSEKERIATELNIAAEIQSSMLPCIFPPYPDRTEFDIYASMKPAKEIGGDFYDFFFIDEDTLAIVIADVSGKGVPASLFMVITKILIENNAYVCKNPKDVLQAVNNTLYENNDTGMFVTVFMGYYYIKANKFVYVNAGHNPPLLKRKEDNFEYLDSKPSNILGWKKNAVFTEFEINLNENDTLFLYTDCVTEATNENLDLFSEARLREVLNKNANLPLEELLNTIKQEIDLYANGTEQADDITMLALKINPLIALKNQRRDAVATISIKTFDAKIENLPAAIDFINNILEAHNCSKKDQNNINLAAEEIIANIVGHAYIQENNGTFTIKIEVNDGNAIIIFEDYGVPFDPLEKQPPDVHLPLEEREIGGLGIFLVKNLMDKVIYNRIDDKNVLTLVKTLKK